MNRIDRKRKEMDIYFLKHSVEKYQKRMSRIDSTTLQDIDPETMQERQWVKNDKLEKEIKRKGRFFWRDEETFNCIVSNLKVYGGKFGNDNKIFIITAYPYSKKMKRKMREDNKIIFEDE